MAIVNYDERAKRDALERGLSKELNVALTLQDAPDDETFLQFVARINRLDKRIRAHAQQLKSTNTSNTQRPPTPRTTPAPVVIPVISTTATGTHPGPMELNTNRRRITVAERQRRIAQVLCVYCGGTGYFASQCPSTGRRPDRLRDAEANLGQGQRPVDESLLSVRISSSSFSDMGLGEGSMEGDHLVVACQLACDSPTVIPTHALVDNGARDMRS